jgi:hypothetical protein
MFFQMSTKLHELQDQVNGYQHTIKNFFATQKGKFESVINVIIGDSIKNFQQTVNTTIQESLSGDSMHSLCENIEKITRESIETHDREIKTIGKEVAQDICSTADDAHAAVTDHCNKKFLDFKDQLRQTLSDLGHTNDTSSVVGTTSSLQLPKLRNPCFPNAAPVSPYVRKRNPYDTPPPAQPNPTLSAIPPATHHPPQFFDVQQDAPIPQTVRTGPQQLPPVNHDQALKRARIQFTGLGDIFVFYNQMMNAMEQFGIFLVPLPEAKYQVSLCPNSYHGIPIDHHRKQTMAGTLYQKLQNPEVIPTEYTAMRNIINRFAEKNDGYEVLYAMLELVHPALHKDAVMSPPKSSECGDDIHLYAQKFDAWLRYETYANRPYTPREQINKFVNELSPTFAPAITRVRRLLDAWNPWDLVVPEVLKITALPNTIDRFMTEEAGVGVGYIRAVHASKKTRQGHPGKPMPPPTDVSDKTCTFCGCQGHDPPNCHFMAKLVIATESLKKVDNKVKKELKDNLKQQQKQRREQRLQKHTSTIRQLLDQGGSREEIDAVLNSMHLEQEHEGNSDNGSQVSDDVSE